ncbi:MAG: DUF488 domain-containing protein [Methanomassiliicoccales archaeon]|nr:DUF488 domain-containing protein [Methanomassiliicoccales archaeon]
MANKVYTIGYEGKTIDDFVRQLKKAGVKRVADVRKITSSRKRDFSKTRFSELLAKDGIEYVGMRELGTPDDVRRFYKSGGSVEEFLRRYQKYIDTVPEAMTRLESVAKEEPTAIMCYENDVKQCHRQLLAKKLQKKGFEVENL